MGSNPSTLRKNLYLTKDEIDNLISKNSINIIQSYKKLKNSDGLLTTNELSIMTYGLINAKTRKKLMERDEGRTFPTLVHPNAVVAEGVEIGEGSVVMAGAVINPGVRIGRGCIVNTSSSIDHDCVIGGHCHIAVGAHLCGTVVVGEGTWIGAGATVSNNVNICSNATIGAGAVVIHDIEEEGTYIGVPAKNMSKQKLTGGGTAP